MSTTKKTYTFAELRDVNARWWRGEDVDNPISEKCGMPTPQSILEQNTHTRLLPLLNQYVITDDSQDGTTATFHPDPNDETIPDGFKNHTAYEYQQVYLCFHADKEMSKFIRDRLDGNPHIAYTCFDGETSTLYENEAARAGSFSYINTITAFVSDDETKSLVDADPTKVKYDHDERLAYFTFQYQYAHFRNLVSDTFHEFFVIFKYWGAVKDEKLFLPRDKFPPTPINNPEDYVIATMLGLW